eukprot:TRINITY_DN29070_c0_g1_i1.p1 TRINITY_DN29070_c0_g1~~TRINITY_DN29070_c0_g1_i1.p1  ORF type:complete len:293 (-),score=31.31 TRINITY_DN29070_c0_g1_i1:86-943(-)
MATAGVASGPFCTDSIVCAYGTWWCGYQNMFLTTLALNAVWFGLFYASAYVLFPWSAGCRKRWPSKYENEETPWWFANHVVSTIHALLISVIVVPAWVTFIPAPPQAQFQTPSAEIVPWLPANAIASDVAHIFLSYIVHDLIAGFLHGLHQQGNAVHHLVFIAFTTLIMYNCFLAFPALTLLLMETSTPFLNYYTFWRNRVASSDITVSIAVVLFGGLFFVCRIVCLCGITIYFGRLLYHNELEFVGTPGWHIALIFAGLAAALAMQTSWFLIILKKMKAKVRRE